MPMLAISDRDVARIVEALRCLAAAKADNSKYADSAQAASWDFKEAREYSQLADSVERSAELQKRPLVNRPPCRCDQAPGMCVLHGVGEHA